MIETRLVDLKIRLLLPLPLIEMLKIAADEIAEEEEAGNSSKDRAIEADETTAVTEAEEIETGKERETEGEIAGIVEEEEGIDTDDKKSKFLAWDDVHIVSVRR
mmetsp:Transcript_23098/g.31653  ORF Transcript_23098/g.31653 Transcript_23098/m.31653 type:complete len:104 (+) Transcript_23098:294-605(+)